MPGWSLVDVFLSVFGPVIVDAAVFPLVGRFGPATGSTGSGLWAAGSLGTPCLLWRVGCWAGLLLVEAAVGVGVWVPGLIAALGVAIGLLSGLVPSLVLMFRLLLKGITARGAHLLRNFRNFAHF